jgi:hypothetical protein
LSERGVFAVDRGIFDHSVFAREPFTQREAWIWLIAEAAYKPRTKRADGKVISLQRGQLCHALRFMAEAWQWSKSRVDRFLDMIEKQDMIRRESGTRTPVITICKYDEYQRVSLPDRDNSGTTTGTTAGQQRDKLEDIETIKGRTEAEASVLLAADDFDAFWKAFPKRSGNNSRKNAESRFRSAVKAGVPASIIIDGAKRYAAHCEAAGNAGSAFVKMAEAWINGRLWESTYDIAQARAGPAPRRTFGQIAREAAATIAGHDDDQQPDRQADFHDGPTLDLVAGGGGADIVDLQPRRAGGGAWRDQFA